VASTKAALNENKLDNRIENLQLLDQCAHQSLHSKLRVSYGQHNGILSKVCSICRKVKPLDDFAPNTTCIGGVSSRCRVCFNQLRKVWRKKRMEMGYGHD
jgi:hypothetical protein